jgi:hypothetical protein
MSRSIQGIYLNQGQDFDGPLRMLIDDVRPEIQWELAEAIPAINRLMPKTDRIVALRNARYIERHAPIHLHSPGPKWYESAPVVSRILTIYDRLRDHPRASKHDRN